MTDPHPQRKRSRLPRDERHAQLLRVARQLLDEQGTDEFTLGRLAARAGVSKPVAYDHFADRSAVLVELYHEFEQQQHAMLSRALQSTNDGIDGVCSMMAGAYIDCWLAEGRELSGVVAALAGSPELIELRREAERGYIAACEQALTPLVGPLSPALLPAVIGAGDALAAETIAGTLDASEARRTLATVLVTLTHDSAHAPKEQST